MPLAFHGYLMWQSHVWLTQRLTSHPPRTPRVSSSLLPPSQENRAARPTLCVPSKLLLTLQSPGQVSLPRSGPPCTLWVRSQCTSFSVAITSLNCGWSLCLCPWWTGGSWSPASLWPSPEPGVSLEALGNTLQMVTPSPPPLPPHPQRREPNVAEYVLRFKPMPGAAGAAKMTVFA